MISKFSFLLLAAAFAVAFADISTDTNDLKFFSYPSSGDRREITFNNVASLQPLVSGADTLLIIDGFLSDSTSPMSQHTKNSALQRASSAQNVIVVDWGRLSGFGSSFGNIIETGLAYSKVLNNVGPAGGRVADFIAFIQREKNISPSQVWIVGHSLGAHIAGAAGTFYKDRYGGQLIGRISGLDPAGPFFNQQVNPDKRLDSGDATFVDIYHSNRGTLGDSEHQTGDINVYINGGDAQPGCEEADSAGFAGYCSHSYSWKFFDSTYHQEIRACPCTGLPCQCKSNCNTQCSNPVVIGAHASSNARGALHLLASDPLNQYV